MIFEKIILKGNINKANDVYNLDFNFQNNFDFIVCL